MKEKASFFNIDCVEGCQKHISSDSVDLIVTDPPYGINGDTLHKHYNRKENHVIDGYIEVPKEEYPEFTMNWIKEAARILKPGGSIYIVSGYTNLLDILVALRETPLEEVNHIVWKYNFGVFTTNKYVSSHYHILYYVKPPQKPIFNTCCRYGLEEKKRDRSLNYSDREDVWIINREYKQGKSKNKNELPFELLKKIIQYSSNEGDLVCDLFLGSFSTAKVAIGLNRKAIGFEKSKKAFKHQMKEMKKVRKGEMLAGLRKPKRSELSNQRKPWPEEDKKRLFSTYTSLRESGINKKESIDLLSKEFGRGYFSILNIIKQMEERNHGKR